MRPGLLPEVFGWLGQRGSTPAGAPFWKYNLIDMERQLEVEVGVPVGGPMTGDDRVLAGVLPAGKYATLRHVGHPAGLLDATKALLDWAAQQGLSWDVTETAAGERWGGRLEIYETDPAQEPDMDKWETKLAFRLAG
ncbi:MAG TPA: GyrI-like domain-containing protein [Streptosporangiaceae bacterium]